MKRLLHLALLCGLLGTLPRGAAATALTSSASGRVIVAGADSLRNAAMTQWAEEANRHCEELLGVTVPFSRETPLVIVLSRQRAPFEAMSESAADGHARIVAGTGVCPGDEALVDAYIRTVLQRLAAVANPVGSRGTACVPPPWLVVGLAGCLSRDSLAAAYSLATAPGLDHAHTPVATLMGWEVLPAGWHGPRAACVLATSWLLGFPNAWQKISARLFGGGALTPAWMAEAVVGVPNAARMESRWAAWCDRQDHTVREFGGLTSGMVQELRSLLPLAAALSRRDEPVLLAPDEVIERRRKIPMLSSLCFEKIQQIRRLTLGKAPELVAAGEGYCEFYQDLARGCWGWTLRRRLARAAGALDTLERLTRQRAAYVDDYLRRQGDPEERFLSHSFGTVLEKSALESYVDQAERELGTP